MKNGILYLSFLILTASCITESTQKAFVCVPVADLISEPIENTPCQNGYTPIPLSSKNISQAWRVSTRLHQILFNEQVTIIEKRPPHLCIEISSAFYLNKNGFTPQNRFWIHANSLMIIDQTIDSQRIPPPIDFKTEQLHTNNPLIITLQEPFYDPISKQTFSAGTRFIKKEHSESKDSFTAWLYNTTNKEFITIPIPKKSCISIPKTAQERRALMVTLLKKLANLKEGYIPYVLGGSSFCKSYTDSSLSLKKYPDDYAVVLADTTHDTIPYGFDCSNLILFGAQLCGGKLFSKNTVTLRKTLDQLTPSDTLQEGDLIWIQGHIMLVADLKKNTLIEARGYTDGYGKVHEMKLNTVFEDINTYSQLVDAFHSKKILHRMDKEGIIKNTYEEFALLNMDSVWK